MNANYFFNQTMGVNSLEKLHKTKFHYTLDIILNQRTLGVPYLSRNTAGVGGAPQTQGLDCRLGAAHWMTFGKFLDLCVPSTVEQNGGQETLCLRICRQPNERLPGDSWNYTPHPAGRGPAPSEPPHRPHVQCWGPRRPSRRSRRHSPSVSSARLLLPAGFLSHDLTASPSAQHTASLLTLRPSRHVPQPW